LNRRLDEILPASKIASRNKELIRALVLLWHDHLDAAHVIAQDIENADGAFVHGSMHRREPDYSNAAYWFRRVGKHPAFEEIGARTKTLLAAGPVSELQSKLLPKGVWDPFAFIQLCENAASGSSREQKLCLQKIQAIETAALIDFCWKS
jgi:hypothetical protein